MLTIILELIRFLFNIQLTILLSNHLGFIKFQAPFIRGILNFNSLQINDGDIVSYNITAIDASAARNSIIPNRVKKNFLLQLKQHFRSA
jgi:hypothetical protein